MEKKVIVIGAGLAGLSAAMSLAKSGVFIYLVSLLPARRSHSVCAQGGINAAISDKNGDSPILHSFETIKGGDFLADQPPTLEMCLNAPYIIKMLDQIGCLFNRDENGDIDFRGFGGTLFKRTAYVNSSTGQQLIYSLDEQVRRLEEKNKVKRFENHEFIKLIKDKKNRARGAVFQNHNDLNIFALFADAVVIATGGLGLIFGKSTNSYACTGVANSILFTQGMKLANPEFIQIHPTAILGEDKLRLISEAVRAEGARIWVYGDETKEIEFPDGTMKKCGQSNEKWFFLEEMYPEYKNLVPRDIAAREILKVCELGLGIDKKNQVYLDATHLSDETLKKVETPLNIYQKFRDEDPKKVPMKVFVAVHYTMGGAYVDWPAIDDVDRDKRFRQMSNIEGLFNIGESDYLYHGANRLGANALLACIFSGLVAAKEIPRYIDKNSEELKEESPDVKEEIETEEKKKFKLLHQRGDENVYDLHQEMASLMLNNVTVKRNNKDLKDTLDKLIKIESRIKNIQLVDKSTTLNQSYIFARQFPYMLKYAMAITLGAIKRDESRGSHFKKEFSKRDDKKYLKTTLATYNEKINDIEISYKDVDVRHFDPIDRTYQKQQKIPDIKNYKNFEKVL
ncbi:MAG: Fumarate reductase flavoprotein subunit [Candidatus Anoxychlamydiales bacterium]|nr:Fumarate reductase flavoprotein subunit [Candidatus Anoxychlamydiales bacterium]NGX35185.1 Fumarate reductase flavoprotein subunit [Candidatus Anoxychlamydiales bacterium]